MVSPRVLISGAGVAGLTAAICLGRNGVRPVLVEKAPEIRADGFIITLSHHCYELAREMGLLEDLQAMSNDVARSSYHDGSGRAILELDYDRLFEAGSVIQIMRDDLENVLYRHAREHADFMFSNSVSALEDDQDRVQVNFENGQTMAFDIVVGADGVHSAVRQCAFDDNEITQHPLGLHAAAFRATNTLGLTQKYEAYLEPKRHTIVYTTRTGDIACIFIWRSEAAELPSTPEERIAHLATVYHDADPHIRRILDGLTQDTRLYMDALVQIDMPRWHKRRVVLTGDAAHALTQLSGQGASISMAGAHVLAQNLIREPFEKAFSVYEQTVRPHIDLLQPKVRRNAKWYVPANRLQHISRDLAFRLIPNELWVRYFKSKYANA